MGFSALMLADAARPAEGLLHILGGGINRLWRQSFPAPMDCTLVGLMDIPAGHDGSMLRLAVDIKSYDGRDTFAHYDLGFQPPDLGEDGNYEGNVAPMVIDLAHVLLPRADRYVIQISVDGDEPQGLHFAVAVPPQPQPTDLRGPGAPFMPNAYAAAGSSEQAKPPEPPSAQNRAARRREQRSK